MPRSHSPDREAFLQSISRRAEPADLAFVELWLDPEPVAALVEGPVYPIYFPMNDLATAYAMVDQRIQFHQRYGFDAFVIGGLIPLGAGPILISEDATSSDLSRGTRIWVNEGEGCIRSWADFDRFPWPEIGMVDFRLLDYAGTRLPDGMGILGEMVGVLEPVSALFGYQVLCTLVYDQPDLVAAVFQKIRDVLAPAAENTVQRDDVIALVMGDDLGFRSGPLISPKFLRRWVFPIQQEIAAIAHRYGKPFLLHCCGNLHTIMNDLVYTVGIDAKHSYEDLIQPVEQFNSQWGDRISVLGGVDMDLLVRGTPDQVRRRTREILEACAPSGGYLLGTGNTLANYIPLENYLTMMDEGRKWRS